MIRSVFIGSSEYGLPALQLMCRNNLKPILVISQPNKPAGRNLRELATPISLHAILNGLPLLTPQDINSPESIAAIMDLAPDIIITASYGGMIGKKLRFAAPGGAINLHPSLLPKYRGASPINSALLNGEKVTGTSIYRLIAALDAGPIIAQAELPILAGENYSCLHIRLADQAAGMLLDLLNSNFSQNGSISQTRFPESPQDHEKATWCPKIDSSLCNISWHNPAEAVYNKIRAFSCDPGAWVYFRNMKLKILTAELTDDKPEGAVGTIARIVKNLGFTVNCSDYQLLVTKVQAAGKKIMDAGSYTNGARVSSGEKLWM
ncbi:MAG: methionyl-tRNA formyltransferase [Candidatus Cloacimonetes bacterium]|nr:methionyl-tRNA formyltransferase [Candidatus Cloacimonadota bacterium]